MTQKNDGRVYFQLFLWISAHHEKIFLWQLLQSKICIFRNLFWGKSYEIMLKVSLAPASINITDEQLTLYEHRYDYLHEYTVFNQDL